MSQFKPGVSASPKTQFRPGVSGNAATRFTPGVSGDAATQFKSPNTFYDVTDVAYLVYASRWQKPLASIMERCVQPWPEPGTPSKGVSSPGQ